MTSFASSLALAASGLVVLTACSSSSSTVPGSAHAAHSQAGSAARAGGISARSTAARSTTARSTTDTSTTARSTTATSATAADIAAVDVCGLLSPADAAAVAREQGLNGAQTAATKYTLTATKQPSTSGSDPTSSCEFSIDGQGASGTVVIQVSSAKSFDVYAIGKKVPGLGDEAYNDAGSTVVRVGPLMLQAEEDSFSDDFVVALFRRMIPRLR